MNSEKWDVEIKAKHKFFSFNFREIYEYRDLLILIIQRDFKASYKQTILGPLWFFIQPVVNSLIYFYIFGKVLRIDLQGMNPFYFYLTGIVFWNLFSSSFTITSNVFISNSGLFSKIYFPRIIIPFAIVCSAFMRFIVQFVFLIVIIFLRDDFEFNFSLNTVFMLLISLISVSFLAMSLGLFVANLTRKYRDLSFLVSFGLQLLMYVTPILYPTNILSNKQLMLIKLNPLTTLIQSYRSFFFKNIEIEFYEPMIVLSLTMCLVFFSLLLFNKVARNFVDTI